jgi:sensor histidine kinase YesM
MLQKWSLRTRLFAIYSLIVFLVIPLSYVIFYHYYKSMAYRSLSESFQWEAAVLAGEVEKAIDSADGLAMNTLYHPSIESWMNEASAGNNSTNNKVINVFNKMRLDLDIEPDGFNRISIIKDSGTILTFGSTAPNREQARLKIASLNWFEEIADKPRLLLPPHRDDWDAKGKMVVSVIRSGTPDTLIEVQIPYSYLEAILSGGKSERNGKQVILYGEDNEMIFPLDPLPEMSGPAVTAEHALSQTGWRLVVTQPMDQLLKSVRKTGYWMAVIAAGLSLLSLAMVYFFTSRTTKPLVQLSHAMSQLPGDAVTNARLEKLFARWDTREETHNEIVHLYHAFREMLKRLEESKQHAVAAHSRELQAQFVALQAQMNPHFLYNTLTLIGMLGMEDDNEEIVKITSALVQMLRYITYESRELVTLKEEIDHALRYLDIMQIRYRNHLQVHVRTEGDLTAARVPKLTVQPFVENCVKHGFAGKKYPWRIELTASVTASGWNIRIEDDGGGFDDEYLREFAVKRRQTASSGPDSEGGLGILNTYRRLHHTFGNALQFAIYNNETGGASVSLGCHGTKGEKADAENIAS